MRQRLSRFGTRITQRMYFPPGSRKSLDFQVRFHSPYLLPSNSLGARIRVDTLGEELHALAVGILQQLDVQGKSQYV